MDNCEAMTSSTRSFAYSYRLVKKCFLKICETLKCHNFLIFQPILIRFSLFCSTICILSSKIKLNLFPSSPLTVMVSFCFGMNFPCTEIKINSVLLMMSLKLSCILKYITIDIALCSGPWGFIGISSGLSRKKFENLWYTWLNLHQETS